jgi:hypothetical protein
MYYLVFAMIVEVGLRLWDRVWVAENGGEGEGATDTDHEVDQARFEGDVARDLGLNVPGILLARKFDAS